MEGARGLERERDGERKGEREKEREAPGRGYPRRERKPRKWRCKRQGLRGRSLVTLPRMQPVLAHSGRGVGAPHLGQVPHQER